MYIDRRKMLVAGLVAALAATASVGYAGGDRHERRGGPWNVLEPSVDREETIVISLATNPYDDPEPACVALQIGMNLLMKDLNGDEPGGKVKPADSVTLFATLDGVELVAGDPDPAVDPDFLADLECLTPDGPDQLKPLSALLKKFVLVTGGEVVACPLCWAERGYGGEQPAYGVVANAFDIHDLFLTADKVLSF